MSNDSFLNLLGHTDKVILSERDIGEIQVGAKCIFADDYRRFLTLFDGYEGDCGGKNYVNLWKGRDLILYNKEYEVEKYLEGMLLFGSDGGGEAFAFDTKSKMAIFRVPFVGMRRKDAIKICDDFSSFVHLLFSKDLYE